MDHALRRRRLGRALQGLGCDGLLVARGPNVRYLTGFTGSNGQVVVAADGRAVFLTDGRYEEQAAREAPDVERVVYRDRRAPHHAAAAARALSVATLGFEASLPYREVEALRAEAGGIRLVPVEGAVERLRWVKDEAEVRALERAQELTDRAFEEVLGTLREGVTEREVALALEAAMRRAGAEDRAFPPIVAFGEDAAEPHHRPADRPLAPGDVVKLDFGALVDGYHADMTRSVSLGPPPPEVRDLHALVLRAQEAGIAALRAGARAREVDRAARAVIEEAGLGERFPHGLGHGVGLEIHEGPMLWPGGDEEVPAGAVVTVEPGLYVPGLGGVRVEDVVLVAPDGPRVLGRATRELIALDGWGRER
ncbi:MAG TPA: Xaa-Pro peptidase family protein [Actinomycetota bacterium]|nr:Xaa-Pro peptidase family protein [Actinomycetota bacterium]